MKKTVIIILTVILIILLLNCAIYLYIICLKKLNVRDYKLFARKNFSIEHFMQTYDFRAPSGLEYKDKPSIIVFGCGITNYYLAKDEETINYQLSKYTKRPVYNRAVGGGGIQHAILQVQSGKLDDIIKNSSQSIYILSCQNDNLRLSVYPGPLIDPHYNLEEFLYPEYKYNKDKQLVLNKSVFPMLRGSVLYRLIDKIIVTGLYTYRFKSWNLYKKNLDFAKEHFKKLNNELKKINPNTKFTVMFYYDDINDTDLQPIIRELGENGIKCIFIKSLTDVDICENPKYINKQYSIPTKEAWMEFVPLIAKELNL